MSKFDDFEIKDGVLNKYVGDGGEVVIPEGVTSIGEGVFFECSEITSVTIPKTVTEIGPFSFWCCSNLTNIIIPEGVTNIGERAFNGCASFTSIIIPEGVKSIGKGAFFGCSELTSITIPKTVTSIGNLAFFQTSLKNVFYTGTSDEFKEYKLARNLPSGKNYLFYFSEEKPETEGNYWHYIDGVPTKW